MWVCRTRVWRAKTTFLSSPATPRTLLRVRSLPLSRALSVCLSLSLSLYIYIYIISLSLSLSLSFSLLRLVSHVCLDILLPSGLRPLKRALSTAAERGGNTFKRFKDCQVVTTPLLSAGAILDLAICPWGCDGNYTENGMACVFENADDRCREESCPFPEVCAEFTRERW